MYNKENGELYEMNSENTLVSLTQEILDEINKTSQKKFVCKRLRPAVVAGVSAANINRVYGDYAIIESNLDASITAKYPAFYDSYTLEQISEFIDNPNFINGDFKGTDKYKYGCISGSISDYKPDELKIKFYSTGKTKENGDVESIDTVYAFFKTDIMNSIAPKYPNFFRIMDHVPSNRLVVYKSWIKQNIYNIQEPDVSAAPEVKSVTPEERVNLLSTELALIKNEKLRRYVTLVLTSCVHDYNFTGPASSSGKYHPEHELGEGGLLRHTKCVVKFAQEIMRGFIEYDNADKADEIIAACILHDMDKYNETYIETTHSDHPVTMMNKVLGFINNHNEYISGNDTYQFNQKLYNIARLIGSHSGRWKEIYSYENGSRTLVGNMPYPETKDQWVVHMADLMASRKWVHVNFDENNNIVE